MNRERLLVTGGSGYLGEAVVRAAHGWAVTYTRYRRPPSSDLAGTGIDLDLRDAVETRRVFRAVQPDVVIHTAVSNSRPEEISSIAGAAQAVAGAAAAVGARLIHISSDAVLDGQNAPYQDGAQTNPLTPYGAAKATAEKIVLELHPAACVVRTSLIFGLVPQDKHTRWLANDVVSGRQVRLYTDEICCPIWVENLAIALVELAAISHSGHLNIAGGKPISRWDFGVRVLDALGIPIDDNVVPALAATESPPRPRNRTLDIQLAAALLDTPLLAVDEALRRQLDITEPLDIERTRIGGP
jgi:dTDP-4-dehydrorhamnose reductase